jgi:hypothetical protein
LSTADPIIAHGIRIVNCLPVGKRWIRIPMLIVILSQHGPLINSHVRQCRFRQRAPRDIALQLRLGNQHWDQGWQNSYNLMTRQLTSDPSLRGSMSADSWKYVWGTSRRSISPASACNTADPRYFPAHHRSDSFSSFVPRTPWPRACQNAG